VQQDQCRVNIIALLTRKLSVTVLHHPTTLTTLLQPPVLDSTVHIHVHVCTDVYLSDMVIISSINFRLVPGELLPRFKKIIIIIINRFV